MIRNVPVTGGWIEVICGPMFSGKSEELIRRLRRAEIAGQRVLIVTAAAGPATMTQRLVGGKPAPFDGETIVIGALDSYEARCRACYRAGASAVLEAAG